MTDSLVNILSQMPDVVAYAEKNFDPELSQEIIPSDALFNFQWYMKNTGSLGGGTSGSDIKATYAWRIFTGNPVVKVGIFDVGVYISHPDLYPRISGDLYNNGNVCWNSHGTHVAGLIGAKANNGFGVAGVDWNCQLVSKQIFNQYGWMGDVNATNKIINAVDNGVHIFNHSWGGSGVYSTITLQLAFVYAYKMNRLSVCAAGNNGFYYNPPVQYPAGFQDFVLAVGATDWDDNRAPYSYHGWNVKVVAPGGYSTAVCPAYLNSDIISTWTSPEYFRIKGTSMAAPLVSGLASLIKGKNPSLTNEDIKNIICFSADDRLPAGWDKYTGYGRINSRRAMEWCSSPYTFYHGTTYGFNKTVTLDGQANFYPYSISGLEDGRLYYADRYRVNASLTVPSGTYRVWGRSNEPNLGYNGWFNAQHGVGYTKANYGIYSTALETYVYQVRYFWPRYLIGTFPCASNSVKFAYTTHRINRFYPYPIASEDRQQVGGCPWLFVHNVTDSMWYIGDNNLLNRSEIPENSGLSLTDIYKLNVEPTLTAENQFSMKIIETENDYGYIDKVNFKAVDHPTGTKLGITVNNQIVVYNVNNISSSNDAELNEEDNITRYIRYSYHGNTEVSGFASDSISAANFDVGLPPSGDSLALIFEVSNNQLAAVDGQIKDFTGEVSMYANSSPVPTTKKFSRRENSSVIIIPIGQADVSVDSVIITWFRDYNLKYLFVSPVSYTGYTITDIPLISAIQTVDGEVSSNLSSVDGNYANIDSISMLTLAFSNISDPQSGMVRDYVFETTGRYEKTMNSEGDSPVLRRNNNIPYENRLFNNYPNPFNPKTNIKFSIKSNRWVKITIYDLLGKEVSVPVNQYKEKGEYSLEFNGSNLASGIYFYRIEAGDFVESKKMVLVK